MSTVAAILKHKGYKVSTMDPTALVSEVAAGLSEHRIGAVLVIDKAEQLLGIVSERDIVRGLAANGARTLEMTAGQLMTRAVQVTHPDTTVDEAMQIMTVGRFRHLPVIAKALSDYEGAMILVSHVPEFVKQIRIDETFDLEK